MQKVNFPELAEKRYTTKKYDPSKKIPAHTIEHLKEILRRSPSSINSQPWKFTFITDTAIKQELAPFSYHNEQKLHDADCIVVFSAIDDITLFEKQIRENLPEGAVNYYRQFIQHQPEAEIKSWLRHQVYISLGFFLAACANLEIDSTPMEGIQNDAYKRILHLENYQPLFAVALGYRSQEDANQPSIKPKLRMPAEAVIQHL